MIAVYKASLHIKGAYLLHVSYRKNDDITPRDVTSVPKAAVMICKVTLPLESNGRLQKHNQHLVDGEAMSLDELLAL